MLLVLHVMLCIFPDVCQSNPCHDFTLVYDEASFGQTTDYILRIGTLRLLNKTSCESFDEDVCFVVEGADGDKYEMPVRSLE